METFTPFFNSEVLGKPFQRHHPGTYNVVAIENSHKLPIFDCVLKPKEVDWAFQNRKSELFFILLNEHSLIGIYDYQNISKSNESRNLGQNIVVYW